MESERFCPNMAVGWMDQGNCNGVPPTDDASDKDTKTELGFDLGPRYPFCFTSKDVAIDVLAA